MLADLIPLSHDAPQRFNMLLL